MAEQEKTNSNKKLALKLIGGSVLMFGFAFALVPLYTVFCEVAGLNGKTGEQVAVQEGSSEVTTDADAREIEVEFLAINNGTTQVQFGPKQDSVTVRPGEITEVYYKARNLADHELITQSVPSVAPSEAAQYLKKIECFCFQNQTLAVEEDKLMPIRFYLDKSIPEDIHKISLNYTIFDITKIKEADLTPHQGHESHQS